jgi:hypothetical protein
MDLFQPLGIASLAAICAGLTQATRATRIDSRWLPYVSAAWGVAVMGAATIASGEALTGQVVARVLIEGLALGLGTTGLVAVTTHATTGSTDGNSTAAKG